MKFLKWIRQIWRKLPSWVLFWKRLTKSGPSDQHVKCPPLKGPEKPSVDFDTVKLVKSHKEAMVADLDVCPGMLEPSVLASIKEKSSLHDEESHLSHDSRSLMTVVHSVSTFMFSVLQSGWRLCRWKSSMSAASVSSHTRSRSVLGTPEAEMLREVYLVLWVIRKQLRELARRQERRRRRRMRSQPSHTSRHSEPVQGLKHDARSPL
ncbi:sperm acrosome developmental regulator [Apodemus sylvaticus]|uniref:sperm acrosome developmental regulator n=1 Tax=Apodemus sylvaticus TaxID=10129 RepID=UPI0022430DEB|nr:sperm acrosome developmental regulator [Apodemus sylvaticus]